MYIYCRYHYNYSIIFKIYSSYLYCDTLSSTRQPLISSPLEVSFRNTVESLVVTAGTALIESNRCLLSYLFIRRNKEKSGEARSGLGCREGGEARRISTAAGARSSVTMMWTVPTEGTIVNHLSESTIFSL